ncbi:hypothetical protein F5877DRAFT_70534 [Lentinula edodes]|nr:hypothetical protein F5877DRAFT_70534 [Lentinula edodes]
MSDKDALLYLQQCKVPARWTLTGEFRAMPDNAQNIRNSDGDWTQFKEMSKVDELIESLQSKMLTIKPMVPMLVEAYYVFILFNLEPIFGRFLNENVSNREYGRREGDDRLLRREVVEEDSIEEDRVQEAEEVGGVTYKHSENGFNNGKESPVPFAFGSCVNVPLIDDARDFGEREMCFGQERILGNKVETMGKLNGIDVV